jgi:hypothetical protein
MNTSSAVRAGPGSATGQAESLIPIGKESPEAHCLGQIAMGRAALASHHRCHRQIPVFDRITDQ